jgi:hypothetical protein
MGARNREGIGLSYRPARLEKLIPWNRFMSSLNFKLRAQNPIRHTKAHFEPHASTVRFYGPSWKLEIRNLQLLNCDFDANPIRRLSLMPDPASQNDADQDPNKQHSTVLDHNIHLISDRPQRQPKGRIPGSQ